MELQFRKSITRLGQLPWILLRPSMMVVSGRYYDSLHDMQIMTIILLFVSLGISYTAGSIIKFFVYKPRPQVQSFVNRWQKIDASSFPSIHAANAVIIASFSGIFLYQCFQTISVSVSFVFILFAIIIICCMAIALSRITLHKHYPIDVLSGTIFGLSIVGLVLILSDIFISMFLSLLH